MVVLHFGKPDTRQARNCDVRARGDPSVSAPVHRGSSLPAMFGFLWRLFEFWLVTVGVVACLSGPLECLELIIDVLRKLANVAVLASKQYCYQAYNATFGLEL